jgi:KDO2-lipid IV(A) lauroyltransferase
MWAFEAALLALLWKMSANLSPDRASAACRRLLKLFGPRLSHKTRIFKRNLALAFPDKTAAELDALSRQIWGNLGAVLAEYPHLEDICGREAEQRIKTQVKGNIQALSQSGKGAIFVSAHLANWEVCPAAGARLGLSLKVVYTPLQNPWLDRMLLRHRQALGYEPISRDGSMPQIIRQLAAGGSVGMIIDQRFDNGEPVPFFGMDKCTTLIPARLALRFNCELVPVRVERLQGARFRVTFYEPVRPDNDVANERDQLLQMMTQVNALFETWIREHPQQWLCSKRRWPKTAKPLLNNST